MFTQNPLVTRLGCSNYRALRRNRVQAFLEFLFLFDQSIPDGSIDKEETGSP